MSYHICVRRTSLQVGSSGCDSSPCKTVVVLIHYLHMILHFLKDTGDKISSQVAEPQLLLSWE